MIGRKLRKRYEIIDLLGDGSTSVVYKALDTRLNRTVALKVLLPHVRESTQKRFFQEATAVAQLNHPGIMAIYDIDEDNGHYFLVVEYVEGTPLSRFIPSPPEHVASLGAQIADALHYAHERGVIHRDVKPANIKVSAEGYVKIMDLGLALPPDAKRVTADGLIIGTPAYISPEQAQGLEIDSRADLYSLGVVLYELATGRLPFTSDDIPALLLQHVKQMPPRPRTLNPSMPGALESVILKAIEKNPARRYQTGQAMAAALLAAMPAAATVGKATQSVGPVFESDTPAYPVKRSAPLRLVVADDHTLLRRTLISYIAERDDMVVVGEAGDGETALNLTLDQRPNVLLLDLNMPGVSGLEVLPRLRALAPDTRVLVLTGQTEDEYIVQALRRGAQGYILKSSDENELIDSIRKVASGHLVLGEGVAERVVSGMLRIDPGPSSELSELERQILLLVAAGYDNNNVSVRLKLPVTRVVEVLAQVMDKLNARDRHAAALLALRKGYISLDELHVL